MFRRSWLLLAMVLGSACPPGGFDPDAGEIDGPIALTPKGGTFIRKGAVLTFPEGAVTENVDIFVTIVDTGIPDIAGRKRVSFGYRISPTSLRFTAPITMTLILPVIPDRVPKGVDPNSFDMRRQQGTDAFIPLFAAKTLSAPEGTVVQAVSEKLGLFWVTGPREASIQRIELDPAMATVEIGKTQQFKARVLSPTGEEIDVPVTWKCVPPRVGSVDANGVFTATDSGRATVTATAGMSEAKAVVSVPGVTVGPMIFTHENPFPTGNDLYGGAIAPGALGTVFSGGNGTVLANAAGTWTKLFSNPATRLYGVGGTTQDNAVAVGILGDADLAQGVLVEFHGTSAPTVRTLPTVQPTHLWTDGTSGIAGGVGNDILVKRGGKWATEGSPTFNDVLAVTGNAQGGFVLVGNTGRVYRYDPVRKVWDSLFQQDLAVLLQAATFADEPTAEAWAVGGSKLWHFVQGAWASVPLPASPRLSVIRALETFDRRVFLAGESNSAGTVLAYSIDFVADSDAGVADAGEPDAGVTDAGEPDAGVASDAGEPTDAGDPSDGGTPVDAGETDGGTSDAGEDAGTPVPPGPQPWAVFSLRAPQKPLGFVGGGGSSTVGYVTGTLGAVWSWNASTKAFDELSKGFYGDVDEVSVLASNEVIIGVNECVSSDCTLRRGVVRQRGALKTWSVVGSGSWVGPITAMIARAPNDIVVAIGLTMTSPVGVFAWNGTAWSSVPIQGGLAGNINDFKYCGATLRGVGDNGATYKGSAATLSNDGSPSSASLQSLWCPSETEFWATGADNFGNGYFGSKTMSTAWVDNSADGFPSRPWKAVWSPGQGEGFTFGQSMRGLYFNTEELETLEGMGNIHPEYVWDMWGSHFDNLYAVGFAQAPGRFGFALRHDGLSWTLIDSGSQRAVKSIDGQGDSTLWLGSEGGGVLKALGVQ